MGGELRRSNLDHLLLHVYNQAVVHVANSIVLSSRPMMTELRRLKLLLDRMVLCNG